MTDREQEMMERYIYQVTRRLPGDQRKETALELQELIGDMMEEKEMSVEEVLTKLGDPALLAERYQDITHCLIGPEYYDIYLWFVKVVLLCSAIPVLIAEIADIIRGEGAAYEFAGQANTVVSVIYGIVSVVPEVFTAGLTAFGAVTLVFVYIQCAVYARHIGCIIDRKLKFSALCSAINIVELNICTIVLCPLDYAIFYIGNILAPSSQSSGSNMTASSDAPAANTENGNDISMSSIAKTAATILFPLFCLFRFCITITSLLSVFLIDRFSSK